MCVCVCVCVRVRVCGYNIYLVIYVRRSWLSLPRETTSLPSSGAPRFAYSFLYHFVANFSVIALIAIQKVWYAFNG